MSHGSFFPQAPVIADISHSLQRFKFNSVDFSYELYAVCIRIVSDILTQMFSKSAALESPAGLVRVHSASSHPERSAPVHLGQGTVFTLMPMLLFQGWHCENIVLGNLSDEYSIVNNNLGDILILMKLFCRIGHGQ